MTEETTKTTKAMLEKLLKMPKEVDEEQVAGIGLCKQTIESLGPRAISSWLYSEEWEDTLVPIRLPKGLPKMLKLMDEVRAEHISSSNCDECKTKAGCQLISRNPSEIMLTLLMKRAFAEIIFGMDK